MFRFAEVAVPVPRDGTFTYSIPEHLAPELQVGSRVQVPFGSRVLSGIVLAVTETPPPGIELRPIASLLDDEPALPLSILEMARFAAEYYLAPIGEVVRSALPAPLSRKGERGYLPTEKGVTEVETLNGVEREVMESVIQTGRRTRSELREALARPHLGEKLERLLGAGFLRTDDRWTDGKGIRWEKGVSLREVSQEQILAAVGRSSGRLRVVEYLRQLGRPALVEEIVRTCECSSAIVKSLETAGILAPFTQPKRYDATLSWHSAGLPSAAETVGFPLTAEQAAALAEILPTPRGAFLLHGVTGSGKSEIYARALDQTVRAGKKGIWLVPEIALTPVFARQLAKRFQGRLAVLHSAMSAGERTTEWKRIRNGEVDVVLGPRSAIWAPVEPLGLVVVDEEHESSYKQEETPRYHARDLALFRGARENATVILGSATPSVESIHGARSGRLREIRLRTRVEDRPLPIVEIVDLRDEKADQGDRGAIIFSTRLRTAVDECLSRNEQVILLLNRRGYSPHLICRSCDEDFRCADCSVARTFHKREGQLVCHYCGRRGAAPQRCPRCGGAVLHPEGIGTERVLEKFLTIWPGISADRLDRDTIRRRGGAAAVLDKFERGDLRVLVGTQMVAKGHHFPNVTLTGVISADGLLGFPDFRAAERTFQLLVQVSGRAGRGEKPGRVLIQTFYPQHPAIRHAIAADTDRFFEEELRLRKAFHYPPFTRVIHLVSSSSKRESALEDIEALGAALVSQPEARFHRILGPAPAPIEKLNGKFRFHILVRGENRKALRALVGAALEAVPSPKGHSVDRVVDVDPANVL